MAIRTRPHLRVTGTSKQLIVDGRPFLIRGAELQNSSFSSISHMEPLWKTLRNMNVNTVLGSISWEMIEPVEGAFDFSIVDQLLNKARENDLKLVLLWFGTWKNGISTYVPGWVKLDPRRFPRTVLRQSDGTMLVTETISCLHGQTLDADSRAFKAFMAHLREVDSDYSTVIMVQVENEVGILGDSRDYSKTADAIFNSAVPSALVDFLNTERDQLHPDLQVHLNKKSCTEPLSKDASWADTFGPGIYTDELFMAYHYALYIDRVAQVGKTEWDIPMFANFWLNYGEDEFAKNYPTLAGGGKFPGDYPSGGAVSNVLDIWQTFAPTLDFISPDTYLNDYHRVCETYRHRGQPLFIPEQRRDEYGARRTWLAIGQHHALGACPFALDTLEVATCSYTKHYELLSQVSDTILEAQARSAITGFFFDEPDHPEASKRERATVELGGFNLTIERAFTTGPSGPGYGVVIYLETDQRGVGKFLLIGAGFQVKFKSTNPAMTYTGILDYEEKRRDMQSGEYVTIRRLNGDETRSGHQAIMPNEQPDDGGFPINITIPAVTRIAQCNVYAVAA